MELFLIGIGAIIGVLLVFWIFQMNHSTRMLEDILFEVRQFKLNKLNESSKKYLYVPPKSVEIKKSPLKTKEQKKKISEGLKRYHERKNDEIRVDLK